MQLPPRSLCFEIKQKARTGAFDGGVDSVNRPIIISNENFPVNKGAPRACTRGDVESF